MHCPDEEIVLVREVGVKGGPSDVRPVEDLLNRDRSVVLFDDERNKGFEQEILSLLCATITRADFHDTSPRHDPTSGPDLFHNELNTPLRSCGMVPDRVAYPQISAYYTVRGRGLEGGIKA